MMKRVRISINHALSRIFKYKIVSTRALSELIADRASPPNDQSDRLRLENHLRRLEMATTPALLDRPGIKRGALSFETGHPIFNPSVVKFGDGYIFVSRSTNLSTRLDADYYYLSRPHRSINVVHKLDRCLNLEAKFVLDDDILRKQQCLGAKFGIEDARLFVWKEAVWGIAAGISPPPSDETSDDFDITQIMFRIDGGKIAEFHELKSPNGSKKEKNWIPLVSGNSLFFIYGIRPYSVFRFDAGELKVVHGIDPKDNYCSIRGSTQFVPWKGRYLGVAHLDREYVDLKHYRRHVFVVIDRDMNLEQVSEPFFFQRKGLEFACGLSNHDSGLVLAFGVMNRTAEFCILPYEELSRWVAF
jgi:hypothetical protein